MRAIQSTFTAEGYTLDLKVSDRKAVHSAFIRFRGLLHELDLPPYQDEVLAVKIEVDTDPPAGAGLATTVIRRHVPLQIHHHDQASLLAGKLHAVLLRYTRLVVVLTRVRQAWANRWLSTRPTSRITAPTMV